MMEKTPNERSEPTHSGPNDSEKSSDYVRFENAAKIVFRYDPERAKRKAKVPKAKKRTGS
jgi:hypothetical protein